MPSLLIAYDGSDSARSAIRAVGGLFPRADALVVVAHERPISAERAMVAGAVPNATFERCIADLAREVIDWANATAEEGTELAAEAGVTAESVIVVTEGGVWPELLATARERNSDVIVCGARGRGGMGRASWLPRPAANGGWSRRTRIPSTGAPPRKKRRANALGDTEPVFRANPTAAITSATPAQRAISAGLRSIDPFQTSMRVVVWVRRTHKLSTERCFEFTQSGLLEPDFWRVSVHVAVVPNAAPEDLLWQLPALSVILERRRFVRSRQTRTHAPV